MASEASQQNGISGPSEFLLRDGASPDEPPTELDGLLELGLPRTSAVKQLLTRPDFAWASSEADLRLLSQAEAGPSQILLRAFLNDLDELKGSKAASKLADLATLIASLPAQMRPSAKDLRECWDTSHVNYKIGRAHV